MRFQLHLCLCFCDLLSRGHCPFDNAGRMGAALRRYSRPVAFSFSRKSGRAEKETVNCVMRSQGDLEALLQNGVLYEVGIGGHELKQITCASNCARLLIGLVGRAGTANSRPRPTLGNTRSDESSPTLSSHLFPAQYAH